MGAVQSDLKSNIVQAAAGNTVIPPSCTDYWKTFWQRPETAEHVFETITPTDIRNMRDNPQTFKNLETLISEVSIHLINLRWTCHSLSDKDAGAGKEVLNCIRILTRVLPFIYECDALRTWERSFFWEEKDVDTIRPSEPPLSRASVSSESLQGTTVSPQPSGSPQPTATTCFGFELIDSLLDLAFWSGFTLPASPTGQNGATYGFWQSGIAYERRLDTSKEFESRRTEIMQLLLVMESKSIYATTAEYAHDASEAVQCVSDHPNRKKVQYLLCSLLNTVVKYQPDARYIRYGESPREVHETHVRTCLHFLHVNLLNRAPWSDENKTPPPNRFRELFSHLHKATHLQFLADGIVKILRQPLEASNNALQIVQRPLTWAHEIIPLLWEAMYCNKYFRAFICETGRQFELTVYLLFYILDPSSKMEGVIRVSVLCLQAMSESPEYAQSLNKPFDGHDNLPTFMQIKNFHGTYADYLMTRLLSLLKPDQNGRINTMSASIVGIIVNISPYVVGLGRVTSTKLVQMLDYLSRHCALAITEVNAMVASNLARAINTIIEEHGSGHNNENVLLAVWKAGKTFQRLADLRMEVDESFRLLVEGIREHGIAEPTQAPDGAVLLPIIDSTYVIEMNKNYPQRFDHQGSASNFDAESRRGSLDVSSFTGSVEELSKAHGKKPEKIPIPGLNEAGSGLANSAVENGAEHRDASIVQTMFQQMPLSTTLLLIVSLDAWAVQVLIEKGIEPTRNAFDTLTMDEVLRPSRDMQHTCLEPSKHLLHRFLIQPPFTAMYAAFYWSLVISQDIERAAVSGSGIWSSTKIKLFRIKAGQVQAPSLFSPKGAVDAVGETLVTGLQNLTVKMTGAGANEGT